jgi:hypothetical protein
MTDPELKPWFAPRMSRTDPPYRKGISPISREGYLCFAVYLVGQIGSMALGAALAWWLRDNLILALGVGIVVMIVGVAVSMWLLFRTMGRRTDHTKTYQQYRAERANKS